MLMRHADKRDLRTLAKMFKQTGCSDRFVTPLRLRKFMDQEGGVIALCLEDEGEVLGVVLYEERDDDAGPFLMANLLTVRTDLTDEIQECVCGMIRRWLRSELLTRKMEVCFTLCRANYQFRGILALLGFLREGSATTECGGRGSRMALRLNPEHVGGIIIERILADNLAVLEEA
jgi:hypothetical protein